jgi:hypothetical protein
MILCHSTGSTVLLFENRVLRRILGNKRGEEAGEYFIMVSFITCNLYRTLLG